MHEPFTRPRTTLDLHARGGLAALFGRTRAEFGGHRMSVAAPETGGQQTAEVAAGQQQQAAEQTGQQQAGAQQAGQEQQPAEPEGPRPGEDAKAFLQRVGADGAAKLALQYRAEAGDRRQAQRTAEQQATTKAEEARQKILDDLKPGLIALGVLKADEQPDPQKLTADLQAAQAATAEQQTAARTLTIENAVLRSASGLGVDADRLLDSRRFADTVAKLDPSASDFGAKIKAAIEAAAAQDATLKNTRAVSAAGLQHVGGTGQQPGQRTVQPLEAAVGAILNPTR